jgi:hypothetical protein
MKFIKSNKLAAALAVFGLTGMSAHAVPIDFGTSWPSFTAPNAESYASAPLNRVRGISGGQYANEGEVAAVLNLIAHTTFGAGKITKYDAGQLLPDLSTLSELGGDDGYFLVPSGWTYLVAQYDGKNGGSVVIQLDGNSAKVPWDSAAIWGTGDKHSLSHYSVAGTSNILGVPDGGTTAAMLGLSLLGMGFIFRRKA